MAASLANALLLQQCHDAAIPPARATEGSAGYDLRATEPCTIDPGSRALIKTGWRVAIPHGHYGRIAPRSGLAYRNGIAVMAGVIDEDYRGELKILLLNTGCAAFDIQAGDRIAQLVLERISTPEPCVVERLPDTHRGGAGFGSTGTR